ncbi:RNA polymerase sigma factor [Nocardioides nematodiphilus]|uniref:RNA polymerase sigma factor n=1 Tax=Nocardioides nematodiphilus TaxID=2849669 RepID=UPI001CDA4353|nr:RNA polymerase sigma factor [Nocardioides nematodiphilus]MCA1983616.1 RNA polymerase sigma factor [Nocardioides nematodiphilus]
MTSSGRRHDRDDPVVSAAKQGDPDAWRELYRAHAGRLVLWLQHRSPVDASVSAEDLSHEAWVTAADKIHDFRGTGEEFGGWLFGIARHHAANARRRSGRRATSPLAHADLESHADAVAGPDATVPEQDWVHRALAQLSARERDVMVCLEVIGLDVAATCVALGMSAVSVRVARHRALKRLRGILGVAEAGAERPARTAPSADVHVRTP